VSTIPSGCTLRSTSLTYVIPRASAGKYIIAYETVGNGTRPSSMSSLSTLQITSTPELISEAVLLRSNNPVVGTTYTASSGTWSGFPAATVTWQWYQCSNESLRSDTLPAGCVLIPNATSLNYEVQASDVSQYLVLRETATNTAGSRSYWTRSSLVVIE
jgi:hypothetical protein